MRKSRIQLLLLITITVAACKKTGVKAPEPIKTGKVTVTTIAGDGTADFADGPVLTSKLKSPLDVLVTADGTIYVADAFNHRIRKIAGGQVSTFAGSGNQNTINGDGAGAGFAIPSRLSVDKNGNLYILDAANPQVRHITTSSFVTVFAGTPVFGFKNGPAVIAEFGQSFGIATDAQGNTYIADSQNKRIRKIAASNLGEVTTIAGSGKAGLRDGEGDSAQFFFPAGIVIDKQGNLFVADQNRLRKITAAGIVSTFAGSDSVGFADGQSGKALFSLIEDLVIDEQGNIYASDNNRIRKITAQGLVSTVAGSTEGFADGDGATAKFNIVQGLGIDKQGNVYVADVNNNRIRKISFE